MTGPPAVGRRRTLRGRLTTLTVVVAAVPVVLLLVAGNLLLRSAAERDADARARNLALAAMAAVDDDGRPRPSRVRGDRALAGRVWVFVDGAAAVRGPGDADVQEAARRVAATGGVLDVPGRVRLHALAVPGVRPPTTVVGRHPLTQRALVTDVVLVGSVGLGLLLLAGVAAATWAIAGRALRPVGAMARAAGGWSERDPDARFPTTGAGDELAALARAVNDLLDRMAASLRDSRRLAADLSHELRTPLARIVAELELLAHRERSPQERRDAHAVIARAADEMERIVGSLMAAARSEAAPGRGRGDLREVLEHVRAGWEGTLGARHVRLTVEPVAPGMAVGAAPELVERILSPVLDNAARFARSSVVVTAGRDDRRVWIVVADDGPGVPDAERDAIFVPGRRAPGDDGTRHDGAGLGLALARRLARGAGGDVVCEPAPGPGARMRVTLPA
ncbi:MAG: HAMP domain-containing histidine kinase [Solirubrobacteraceae bacterium]|nr:HAMP domain-containing histidine kinase [Solirubrobacteraceae bacterium]